MFVHYECYNGNHSSPNQDLREKNWKAMEALNAAEKSTTDKVAIAVKAAKVLKHTHTMQN